VAEAVPAGVPPQAAEAARDSLGGAVAAAEQLPDPLAGLLLDEAREAFTQGLQLAALTSAKIAARMPVLAVIALRRAGAPQQDEQTPATEEAVEPARP
jgi:MFS transporter, DHA2 family, multidrug resistance protein